MQLRQFLWWILSVPEVKTFLWECTVSLPPDVAIRVTHLSKVYKVYRRPADMFWEIVTRKSRHKEVWALADLSFEVKKGGVVGVIGRNGAGKSTLLKILAGTLNQTAGQIEINGKVSAILELGTGFHPDFTGRENVYMGGMCLGMSRQEIDSKVDAIIDFAELRHVIDQPFKTYSSGMQARLTFSTAISIQPDIFLVDEALAAGDMLFQEKCFRRIREIAESDSTVFFVTHSLGQIYELCDSAILLANGELVLQHQPRIVGYAYEELLARERKVSLGLSLPDPVLQIGPGPATDQDATATSQTNDVHAPIPGNERIDAEAVSQLTVVQDGDSLTSQDLVEGERQPAKVLIQEVDVVNSRGIPVFELFYNEDYHIRVKLHCFENVACLSVGLRIELPTGQIVYGSTTITQNIVFAGHAGQDLLVSFVWKCRLGSGNYILTAGVAEMLSDSEFIILHHFGHAYAFFAHSNGKFQGLVDMGSTVSVEDIASASYHY
jgi:lipopolysaccharide transport system ATP-binding protein